MEQFRPLRRHPPRRPPTAAEITCSEVYLLSTLPNASFCYAKTSLLFGTTDIPVRSEIKRYEQKLPIFSSKRVNASEYALNLYFLTINPKISSIGSKSLSLCINGNLFSIQNVAIITSIVFLTVMPCLLNFL